MKLYALLAAVFVAGLATSIAIAKPPPGKGHDKGAGAAASTTSSAATLPASGKVVLCHRTGKATKWVRISVSVKAARRRIAKGDVWLQDPAATCAAQSAGTTTAATTTESTITESTTTADTTTESMTTAATTTTTSP